MVIWNYYCQTPKYKVGDTVRISKHFDTYIEGKRYKPIKMQKLF